MTDFEQQQKDTGNLAWWIASLAMSIVLCALFVGYVFDIKEDLNNSKIRAEIMEQRLDMMSSQLDNMRHRMMVQQAQVVPAEKSIQLPATGIIIPDAQNIAPAPVPSNVPTPPADMPPKH